MNTLPPTASGKLILVPGTHDWRNDSIQEWYYPGSEFANFLGQNGLKLIYANDNTPFIWSTDLGGVGFGGNDLIVWAAAGWNLYWFCVPPLAPDRRIPPEDLNIICHSHGLQVVLYACAHGLKVNTLVSVSSPVRKDMDKVALKARENIRNWVHIHSDGSDKMQWIGQLFDGGWKDWFRGNRIRRAHHLADMNMKIPKTGHSDLVKKPELFHLWCSEGLIKLLGGDCRLGSTR